MNDLRTAAQQALERLRKYHYGNGFVEDAECIAALEAALAHQAEPVRLQQMADAGFKFRDRRLECDECGGKFTAQMLPIHKCAQQAEAVEPFGYWFSDKHQDAVCSGWFVRSPCDGKLDGKPGVPLYTAPPQRKPLTEEAAALTAQRNALLEALKLARPYINPNTPYGYHAEVKADAAIKAVEEQK